MVGNPNQAPQQHRGQAPHGVNRERTASHPNLAGRWNSTERDGDNRMYNNSPYGRHLHVPECRIENPSKSSTHLNGDDDFPAFFRDIRHLEVHDGQFQMNVYGQGKKSGVQLLAGNIVRAARHDSVERDEAPRCHPETRKTISQEIWEWTENRGSDTRILWLHGPAGAGKTAIAGSLCERLKRAGRLGGDYFFSRNGRQDAKPLFPTISHHLATTFTTARDAVERSFFKDRDVLHCTTDIQLQWLIIEPLLALKLHSPLVIVIDGLDECEDEAAQCRIIEQIFSVYRRKPAIPNVRFVIASRPEPWITYKFASKPMEHLLHQVPLEQTEETNQDIRTYLKSGFQNIRDNPSHQNRLSNITSPWPCPLDLEQLVEKASGQFIYASTVLKFVNDPHALPDRRLDMILSLKSKSHSSPGSPKPFADLDALYDQILSMIPQPNREKATAILGTVLYITSSTNTYQNEILSIAERLLGLEAGESNSALRSLHSLIHIPPSYGARMNMSPGDYKEWLKDSKYAVRFYHKSFPDFLEDRTRSGEFFVDKHAINTKLAIGCIKILKGMSGKHASSRLYCVAWDYAAMRMSDHCTASGPHSPELQEALKQFDVYSSFAPMFLSAHGEKIGQRTLENIKKKIGGQRFLFAKLFSRHKSPTNNPLEKDITAAMTLLIDHNLMFSSNFLLSQLQALSNWFKQSKYSSHFHKELDIILNDVRSAQRYKPQRRN